ncbi:site-specific DNA-methyltransferase [Psychrobacter fulvigenes]|uniref:site-specific DNA-methyltransferase n=1 Tax=Psychrobacter fulvigenes TaxID=533323 RepID=UPI001918ACF2|nr:site-specific DNA-methyltransferase [Psychrobacter fulvigenes]
MTMSNPIHPTSQTPQQMTLAKLKQLMPEAFSEDQLDIHKLTALLSEQDIAPAQEAYGLSWAGKHQVYRELKTPTSQTLVPAPDESVDFDTSQNLFIEGDNLAVLKILQKSYHSRIKMIYIDPPYNTGNDRFVYADDFSESIADYKARAGQTDADGNLTHSDGMQSNRKENGQYHSNWLNMMYPRLALAKSLLRDDGVIFVSIDDNEVANLRLLMDEIFGEENFIANFIWEKRTNRENRKVVSNRHDYILCYRRSDMIVDKALKQLPMTEKALSSYKNPDNDPRGLWKSDPATAQAGHGTKSQFYELTAPNGKVHKLQSGRCWLYTKSEMNLAIDDNRIWFGKSGDGVPRVKTYLNAKERGLTPESILFAEMNGTNESSKNNLKSLFEGVAVFDTPKPVELLKTLIQMTDEKEGIYLDFFAGTSALAQSVLELNSDDNLNRKFIMVQIPEATEADSEAYKAGFSNIAEISKERIRRAAAHIIAELPESVDSKALDFGFKAYKLADSNFIPWQQPASYDADSLMAQLEKHLDPISDNATTDGIITELMLKEGYTLTATSIEADGYHLVTQNDALPYSNDDADSSDSAGTSMSLVIVLNDMTTDKATQIIASAPNKTLIMDRAFSDDANKANIVLQFEDAGLVVGCV